jgi:hypothetical protein
LLSLFGEQIDLQIEVISSLRLAIHRILTDQTKVVSNTASRASPRKEAGMEGIERPYREGIPKHPQQDKGGLDDHEIDRPDEPPTLWDTR